MKRATLLLAAAFLWLIVTGSTVFAQASKPIEMKLAHFMPPVHNIHTYVFVPYAKEVEEKTNGRVKITIFPAEALGKAKDLYDLAANGVSDISFFIHAYTAGRFPLSSVVEQPFFVSSSKVGSRVLWDIYEKGHFKNEYPGTKVLALWTSGPAQIHMTKKPAKTLADIKGVRLRTQGPQQSVILRALGISPISIPGGDMYDAVQRGMVDGVVGPLTLAHDFKLYELCKHYTIIDMYVVSMGLVINEKVWNGLPEEVKKIMQDLAGARMAEACGASYDKYDIIGADTAKKAGGQFYTLSKDEKEKWIALTKPLNDKWIADMEAKGLPGKQVYQDMIQILPKYSK